MSNGLIPTPSHEVSMQTRSVQNITSLTRSSKDVGWICLINVGDGSEIQLTNQVHKLQNKLVVNSGIAYHGSLAREA